MTGRPALATHHLRRSLASPPVIAALAAVAAHLPGLANGFTTWDDDHYLTNNPLVQQLTLQHVVRFFTSFQLANYHPLALLGHALWHQSFGLAPLAHHALSLGLHALNAALVSVLAGALGLHAAGALVAGLLFAVHPLQVEVVAWVSQLKTLLASAFFLGSLLAYLRHLREPGSRFPAAALALTLCSLLSKPAAVPMPVILVLVDRLKGRRLDRRALLEKVPFVLLALLFTAVTPLAQREALRGFSVQPLSYTPFIATHALLFLLAKAVAPFGLSALYPFPAPADGGLPWTFVAAPATLALLVAVLWRPTWRSPVLSFGTLFFLAMAIPTSQVVPVGLAHTADRYFYLPSIGLFFLVGHGFDRLHERQTPAGVLRRRALAALLAAAVAILAGLSWRRTLVWEDGVSLWGDVVARYPRSFFAWGELGYAQAARGELARALPTFARALELAGNRPHRSRILFARGQALQDAGRTEEAVVDYTRGLEIFPDDARVRINRGNALDALGRSAEALEDYTRAIALAPENPLAWYNRGVTLAGLGDHATAVASFDTALRLDPDYAPGYLWRARSLQALGRTREAQRDLERAGLP